MIIENIKYTLRDLNRCHHCVGALINSIYQVKVIDVHQILFRSTSDVRNKDPDIVRDFWQIICILYINVFNGKPG